MYFLGVVRYFEGKYFEAVPLLRTAAQMKCVGAKMWLGLCHQFGNGVGQDKSEAFELTKSAAKDGSLDAQVWLAPYYMFGIGTKRDRKKAVGML